MDRQAKSRLQFLAVGEEERQKLARSLAANSLAEHPQQLGHDEVVSLLWGLLLVIGIGFANRAVLE